MASSKRPPFPRDGWSTPNAEQAEVEKTRQRLDRAEGKQVEGVDSGPRLVSQADAEMVLLYGGPPVAPAYGGPWRNQSGYRRRSFWLTAAGSLVGLGLGWVMYLPGGALMWALGGGAIGLLAGLLSRRLASR